MKFYILYSQVNQNQTWTYHTERSTFHLWEMRTQSLMLTNESPTSMDYIKGRIMRTCKLSAF